MKILISAGVDVKGKHRNGDTVWRWVPAGSEKGGRPPRTRRWREN